MSIASSLCLTALLTVLGFSLYLLDRKYGQAKYRKFYNFGRAPEDALPEGESVSWIYNQQSSAWLFFLASIWSTVTLFINWCCGSSFLFTVFVFVDCLFTTWIAFCFGDSLYPRVDRLFKTADDLRGKLSRGEVKFPQLGNVWSRVWGWVSLLWSFGQSTKSAASAPVPSPVAQEVPKADHRRNFDDIMRRRGGRS